MPQSTFVRSARLAGLPLIEYLHVLGRLPCELMVNFTSQDVSAALQVRVKSWTTQSGVGVAGVNLAATDSARGMARAVDVPARRERTVVKCILKLRCLWIGLYLT